MRKNEPKAIEKVLNRCREKSESKPKEEDGKNIIYTSFVEFSNGNLMEQVYDKKEKISKFCIWDREKGTVDYATDVDIGETIYRPILDEEVDKTAILLPSKIEEYENDAVLDEDIKKYINKWLDIPEDVSQFALWNIKRSWVFDKFHTLNYLRALGDTGTGKSRFLDTLGYIHYKPINTSGATTPAPIFRIIEKWRGTLMMDEADFQKSDEAQDIIKIINVGYEKGKHIMRCDQNDATKISFFDPYCPKILATRKSFADKAVEGRCITYVMSGTERNDIPPNLNKDFFCEALSLRNKLLLWRFRNYHKIKPDLKIDFDLGELEPRVKQIVTSFVNLFSSDIKQLEKFKLFIHKHQEELIDERKNTFAGGVVGAIYDLIKDGNLDIDASNIINRGDLKDFKGNQLKPRGLSSTLKSLGFGKSKSRKVEGITKRCLALKQSHLDSLFKRYGYEVTKVTIHTDSSLQELYDVNEKNGSDRYNRNNRNSVTEKNEELDTIKTYQSNSDVVHYNCNSCGYTPCYEFDKTGKPLCRTCYDALGFQNKSEEQIL